MPVRCRSECINRYVSNILHGRDEEMCHLSGRYKNDNLSMIKTLNFTQETFSMSIEMLSKQLFTLRDDSTPYIKSLLVFSMELDKFYKLHHYSWYTTDMLIQTLVHILLKTQLFSDNYNKCIILYPCIFIILSYSLIWLIDRVGWSVGQQQTNKKKTVFLCMIKYISKIKKY